MIDSSGTSYQRLRRPTRARTGVSYSADTAIKLAALGRPALRAIAPLHYDFDPYEDLARPGGILLEPRLSPYGAVIQALDGVPGADCRYAELLGAPCELVREALGQVKPVDGPDGAALRAAAIAEHAANLNVPLLAARLRHRDGVRGDASWRVASVAGDRKAIQSSRVPIFTQTGWLDAGTANGVLSQLTSLANPQESWIGPWNHGSDQDADPFRRRDTRVSPSRDVQFAREVRFFDAHLKDGGRPISGRRLHYYTLNEGRWRTTARWPVARTRLRRLYLRADGRLATRGRKMPGGPRNLRTDRLAGTGGRDRWNTNLSGDDVVYPDRRAVDRRLLTYTSAPLPRALRVTGLPRITLALRGGKGSAPGALHAYLEHVAPRGRVTYVTEGQLALEHRAVARRREAWRRLRTPRTFARADARPLPRGRRVTITFDLLPTSVRFARGDRLRIALAAANPDSFATLPAKGRAAYEIGRRSFVTLPVVR